MISTLYQPRVALVLIALGLVVGITFIVYDALLSRLRCRPLARILDVVYTILAYVGIAYVVYTHDYGRVRGYTVICILVGILISKIAYSLVIKVSKKSLTK